MDDRMRDLDRLQEQDPDGRRRTLSTMIALGTLALLLAGVGVWISNRSAASRANHEADELRALEVVHKVVQPARAPSLENTPDEAATTTHTALDTPQPEPDDRPEVEAALAAAEREEQQLAAAAEAARAQRRAAARAAEERAQQGIPASLSASSAGHELAKTANEDQLVAAALPKPSGPRGSEGNEGAQGEFALQVISFETRDAADGFARALRAKGHNSYVLPAHVDGRGRYFRVRIGPFKTRGAAEAYRRSFDEREHMNTILVKRQE